VCARFEHAVHPGARSRWAAGGEHDACGAVRCLQGEVVAEQAVEVGAAQDDVAPREGWVGHGREPQFGGEGLECFDGQQGGRGVQVGGLAVEAIPDDALAGDQGGLVDVVGGVGAGAVLRAPEVVVSRGDEQVEHLDRVPVGAAMGRLVLAQRVTRVRSRCRRRPVPNSVGT
jgi:hypothetical protein